MFAKNGPGTLGQRQPKLAKMYLALWMWWTSLDWKRPAKDQEELPLQAQQHLKAAMLFAVDYGKVGPEPASS